MSLIGHESSRPLPARNEDRSRTSWLCAHTGVLAGFVTTGADDFGLVADALAMSAAIFFFIRWDAVTGGICTFFGGSHIPSFMPD